MGWKEIGSLGVCPETGRLTRFLPRLSVKVNEFVPREVVDKLMKKANPVWQVSLGLNRYGGLRTPSEKLSLRWDDIDWELNRMNIPEPKV